MSDDVTGTTDDYWGKQYERVVALAAQYGATSDAVDNADEADVAILSSSMVIIAEDHAGCKKAVLQHVRGPQNRVAGAGSPLRSSQRGSGDTADNPDERHPGWRVMGAFCQHCGVRNGHSALCPRRPRPARVPLRVRLRNLIRKAEVAR